MLASFNSFSQNVILSENQAKAVAKDIVEGKACKEELLQTQNILQLTETKVELKDKVIGNLENQKTELQKINELEVEKSKSLQIIISGREKELKHQKNSSLFYKIVAVAGVLTSGFLIIR
jgi:hypothetical protein